MGVAVTCTAVLAPVRQYDPRGEGGVRGGGDVRGGGGRG